MKKVLSIFTSVIIFSCLTLSGCFYNTNNTSNTEKTTDHITFITNSTLGDRSFNDTIYEGLKKAKEQLNIDFKVIENQNKKDKYESSVIEASEDRNTDIILVVDMGIIEYAEKHAPNYPDKKYIYMDIDKDYEIKSSNAVGINFKQNEGEFLVGAVASLLSETGHIGFIGGSEVSTINDFLVGYIQGAKYINSDIKVSSSYVGDWSDSFKSGELASAQISQKADVIHVAAGSATIGALDKAAEYSVYSIGCDTDQYELYKDIKPATIEKLVTSFVKRTDIATFNVVKSILDNTQEFKTVKSFGLKENAVGLVENDNYRKYLTEDQIKQVQQIQQDIIDGKITVDTYFGMSTDKFTSLVNSVKP